MRQPARTRQVAIATSVPAPVLGLNAIDQLAAMDPRHALVLTNAFPDADRIVVRNGMVSHGTGMTDPVKAVIAWIGTAGVKLLASTDSHFYNVTSSGTAASTGTSITSGKWQYQNFATSGGNYTIMVNGADTPRKYDGSSVSTNSITGTGLTSTNLINVVSHKSRLWFVENSSANAWYLGTNSISGAAVKFPLGSLFREGGTLQAMGTYSDDAGDGMDDFLAFVSSTGEILLYQGTDPSSANTWSLVTRLKVGAPLGRRCMTNLSGDLLILTEEGVLSMKALLKYDRAQRQFASVSNKIDPVISDAAKHYKNSFGWQIFTYPKSKYLIVNVPVAETTSQVQYVMNTITGAWCKFEGWNANSFASTGSELYFGGNAGTVYRADTGYDDDGSKITADIKTAFNYFDSRGVQKHFTMLRPILSSAGSPSMSTGICVDFEENTPTGTLTPPVITGATWGSAVWDTDAFGGTSLVSRKWTAIKGIGMCMSVLMRISINGGACAVNSFDVVAEPGGTL